jgi:hypothetical protein
MNREPAKSITQAPSAWVYVGLLAWREGTTSDQKIEAAVRALGIPPEDAALAVARDPPLVIARVPEAVGPSVARAFAEMGASVFAPSQRHFARVPPPVLLKRLTPALGSPTPLYLGEAWSGDNVGVPTTQIELIVRARVALVVGVRITDAPATRAWLGPEAEMGPDDGPLMAATPTRTLVDVLDVYLRGEGPEGPRRVRIRSDRFAFHVLGPRRTMSDFENADRLALQFAEEAPHAAVDLSFGSVFCREDWAASALPPPARDLRERGVWDPRFDFHSAWVWLRTVGSRGRTTGR